MSPERVPHPAPRHLNPRPLTLEETRAALFYPLLKVHRYPRPANGWKMRFEPL